MAAITGCGRIPLALLAPAHHQIDLPAGAAGADQPLAPVEDGRFGAVPRGLLTRCNTPPSVYNAAAHRLLTATAMEMKPKVFIGSSKEGEQIANAIHARLQREAECTVWTQGVFRLSVSNLQKVPSRFVLEFDWHGLRWNEDTWSGSKVNRLIGEFLGEAVPSIDFAHGDLT